ncbi:serine/threonine-protein kinase [Streptomyces sp. B6B3]|uniref:serine/threonine-protein kinase n=1 Tax=Streptomyces sp. B6B3 TaxID=3153570 RepID=UPI00325D2AF6
MEPLAPHDPHRIGPYRLLARLGEGGMGTVYLARSDRGRTVAVKTIIGTLASEPDFRRRFAQEITAAQRVGGEWTAPVLDADTQAATPWVATGYIAGPSLHQVVSHDHGPLPERSVLLLAGGLAQALKAIHGAGLVHRDLKPSNVLITIDGPKVIDFGIARALEANPGEGLTRTGATVGSPGFMSPEQVRGQRLTPASDVFCLGSLLAFAATGRTPFGALDSGVHVLMFRIAEELPDLAGVPEGLQQLISSCLAKEPTQRPTVEQLLQFPAPSGGAGEPWLPGGLVAQLGREAVSLLDSESPESRTDTPAVQAPPSYPNQPSHTSPPTPAPSPYNQPPTASYQTPQPQPQPQQAMHTPAPPGFGSPSPYGGAPQQPTPYGSGPYGTPPPGGQRPNSKQPMYIGLAIVAVLAVIGVIAVVALSGGGDDDKPSDDNTTPVADDTPIDDGYLGTWWGEYGTAGEDGWKALWFEVRQGQEGESVGTATVTYHDAMCVYDVQLDSFENKLNFTQVADHSIPENEAQETCRDNTTVQSLKLQENGAMQWSGDGQQATLQAAGDSGQDVVPETLVGDWYDEYTIDGEVEYGLDEVTVEQAAVGEHVLRWSWTSDPVGDDPQITCVTENELAGVDGDRILLSPDILVADESDPSCVAQSSVWVWTETQAGDTTLNFQWTNNLDDDPYLVFDDLGAH